MYLKPLSQVIANAFSAQPMNDTSAIICHAHLLVAAKETGAAVAHGPSVRCTLYEGFFGQIAAACQECYRVDIKWIWMHSLWVNTDGSGCQDHRHNGTAEMNHTVHIQSNQIEQGIKSKTNLKKTDQQQWINKNIKSVLLWITADEAIAFNDHGSVLIQHCKAFCVANYGSICTSE